MMKFKTQFDPHDRVYTRHGDPIVKTFSGRYTDDGDLVLVPTGEENLYDKIQAEAAACDMDNILRKFANGDVSVLSKAQGFYGDFGNAPLHFTDILNMTNEVMEQFAQLPAEEREKYGNNWVKYGQELLNPSTVSAPAVSDPVVPDVKKEASNES